MDFTKDSEEKVSTLISLSIEYKKNTPEKALDYLQKAYDLSEEKNYKKWKMKVMLQMSEVYLVLSDNVKAMGYALKVTDLADQKSDIDEQAHALHLLGIINENYGNYKKSSEYLFESLKLVEQDKDSTGIQSVLTSIGVLYAAQGNNDKAFEYHYRSLTISRAINRKRSIAVGLNNIGSMYMEKGDFNTALKYLHESLEINKEINNKALEGLNYLNLGICSQELNKNNKALQYFNKAYEVGTELKKEKLLALYDLDMSSYFKKMKDFDLSKKHALNALKKGREIGLKRITYDAADLLFQIFIIENDSSNALKYLLIQYQVKDSLFTNKTSTEPLELQYEYEKAKQVQNVKQQRNRLIIIIVFIILFSGILIFILIAAQLKIRAKNAMLQKHFLEDELSLKDKELTFHVMSKIKKNKNLADIAEKLILIQNNVVEGEVKSAIKKIVRDVRKAEDDEIWTEFEIRFKQVHTTFYNMIIEKYPNLTPQDQRLCALLKLNMTTKEISELTGQVITTIEIARTRLRKKLGITNTQINVVTFLSQIG